jgi:alkylation response protein AidB-like acyl-CoA dehydrogenase
MEGAMTDQAELESLRVEVRAWMEANAPRDWRQTSSTQDDFVATQRSWFAKLVEGGYAIPHWPAEYPGGGRTLAEQKVIYEELARIDAPRLLLSFVSTYHAFATLHE